MINRFAYCIDSPHYYHYHNFLTTLHWLASNNTSATIITTGNLPLQSIVDQLGDPIRQIIKTIPLSPLDQITCIRPDEIYSHLDPYFPYFPNEEISIVKTIVPDRCLTYMHTESTKTMAEILVQESNFSEILLIGSATDAPINNYQIVKQATKRGLSVIGFPFGNVSGRYAPFWLKNCTKIYTESVSTHETLISHGYDKKKLVHYEPAKLSIQTNNYTNKKVVIDLGIHSGRHELITLIKSLLKFYNPEELFIQTNQALSFIDFIDNYLTVHNLPKISIGNKLEEVFNAKQLFCLFPFACSYLLENFTIEVPTSIVDLQGRYTKIDNLKFTNRRIITQKDQITRE